MLYPLKFNPILKKKIWGGTKLKTLFNKAILSDNIGESWELSGYEGEESVVSNGFLAGNNISELIEIYMGDLVGDRVFDKFGPVLPLLFKFIDASDDLSIQVHPNDEVSLKLYDSFGKNELWYVVDADPDAELILGFPQDYSREIYVAAIESGHVEDLHQKIPVKKGDVLYVPAGEVHAIGRGIVVAEIQQTSDITYRIYDYKRKDQNGNERDLHVEQALDVINFDALKEPKIVYHSFLNEADLLISNEYFTINILRFDEEINRDYGQLDSFVVYMCIEGSFTVECNGKKTTVDTGETILIPAMFNDVNLIPAGKSLLLETYIS